VNGPDITVGRRRAAVAFVFVTVMLDMLALGMIIPVLPKLVVTFVEGDMEHGAKICSRPCSALFRIGSAVAP
jgi:MFS transporter, DHA1 family, tetracycline resistance protein